MKESERDLSGLDRIGVNTIVSWVTYVVFIVSGFIAPRLIDYYEGQIILGVWDLSWSIVSYLSIANIGVGASLNRYISKYRSLAGSDQADKYIYAVFVFESFTALFVLSLTLLGAYILPNYIEDLSPEKVGTVRVVLFSLGLSLSIQLYFNFSRGVLTGCHRWDLHNIINASSHLIYTILMIIALYMGYGIAGVAIVYVTTFFIFELVRFRISSKIYGGFVFRRYLFDMSILKEMIRFGIKNITISILPLVIAQTTIISIGYSLGAGAVAVFSRPFAIVKHIENFVNKYSFILTTTASSLYATNRQAELQDLILSGAKYSASISWPLLIIFLVMGDRIIGVWMGDKYVVNNLIIILGAGYMLITSQSVALRVLIGINRHGGAIKYIMVIICSIYLSIYIYFLSTSFSINTVGLLVIMPLIVSHGVFIPLYLCRKISLSMVEYIKCSILIPIVPNLVFFGMLLSFKIVADGNLYIEFLIGFPVSFAILVSLYWVMLLDNSQKTKIVRMITCKK